MFLIYHPTVAEQSSCFCLLLGLSAFQESDLGCYKKKTFVRVRLDDAICLSSIEPAALDKK